MSGSGGGGAGSDPVPDYLKEIHYEWLNSESSDAIFNSVADSMNVAFENNPWSSAAAFAPTDELTAMGTLYDGLEADIYAAATGVDPYFSTFLTRLEAFTDAIAALSLTDPETELDNVDFTTLSAAIDALSDAGDDMRGAICAYDALVNALHFTSDWQRAISTAGATVDSYVFNETLIANDVVAFGDVLDDNIETRTLPRFEAGMATIGAVQSSAFAIGKAVIEGFRDRDVAKYETELRMRLHEQRSEHIKTGTAMMLDHLQKKVQFKERTAWLFEALAKLRASFEMLDLQLAELMAKAADTRDKINSGKLKPYAVQATGYELETKGQSLRDSFYSKKQEYMRLGAELERIKIVAQTEQANQNTSLAENEAKWEIELWQHAANMIAAYHGGTAPLVNKQPSQLSSAIGGALGGAAVGGEVGNGWGAGVGAILGAASAFL